LAFFNDTPARGRDQAILSAVCMRSDFAELGRGFLIAAINGFTGAVKLRKSDVGQFRMQRHVRRVTGKPGAGNAILNDVESLNHDRCHANAVLTGWPLFARPPCASGQVRWPCA
jgi:hypothetical protein